jgi:hypothetical protein
MPQGHQRALQRLRLQKKENNNKNKAKIYRTNRPKNTRKTETKQRAYDTLIKNNSLSRVI